MKKMPGIWWETRSLGGLNPQHHSVARTRSSALAVSRVGEASGIFRGFRRDVDISVLALAHVTDSRVQLGEQRFAALYLRRRLIEGDTLQLLAIQRAHE